jgi:hypothetical protein
VPLRKALLSNPSVWPRSANVKKTVALEGQTEKRKTGKAGGKKLVLSLDDQSTVLLLKTCGALGDGQEPDGVALQALGEQFVDPLQVNLVSDVRKTFGIETATGASAFSALAKVADVDNE